MRFSRWAALVVLPLTWACGSADRNPEAGGAPSEAVVSVPLEVEAAATRHLARVNRPAWQGAGVGADVVAIYEPDREAPAFYELPITTGGYLVVDARAPHDVVQWNDRGEGPAAKLRRDAPQLQKVLRLDTAVYVAEDARGAIVAQSVKSLARVDRSGPAARLVATTAQDAVATFAARRLEARLAARPLGFWDYFYDPPAPMVTCSAPGAVPKFTQIGPGSGPNGTSCMSGCGGTAWAMLFGWAAKRAYANPSDAAFAGLFREGDSALGAPVVPPDVQDARADGVTWALRNDISTFCLTDQGATQPWDMTGAQNYANARADGLTVDVDYSTLMVKQGRLRDTAASTICDGRPVILGIGSMFAADMHYPLATAYEDGWFWLEMGWGGGGDAWYLTGTWFTGSIRH